jgi:hypothetical protein
MIIKKNHNKIKTNSVIYDYRIAIRLNKAKNYKYNYQITILEKNITKYKFNYLKILIKYFFFYKLNIYKNEI